MANVTVALDEELLLRARAKAIEQGTTLSGLVRELLEAHIRPSEAELGYAMFREVAERSTFELGDGGITWTRDDLHDRAHLR
jgi:hypothetical protein